MDLMDSRLKAILSDVFRMPKSEVHGGLTKEDVGNWDSLKQMDLVMSLENEYDIRLEIPDILRMVSVAGIVTVLLEKGVSIED